MQKKYWLYLLVCFGLHAQSTLAQTTSCTQVLRLARSTYDQGRLHELPELLQNCLDSNNKTGFTKQEKVEAYKLLALAYTYLEEPEKADDAMLKLLQTDHYFEINEAVDPAEFVALYRTFRTRPIFNIALKVGPNTTFPSVIDNYYIGNAAAGKGKYKQRIGFQFGLAVEKEIFSKSKNETLRRITLAPEILYTTRSFEYSVPQVFTGDKSGESVATSLAIYKQTWVDLNIIFQYKIADWPINPYVGIGPSLSYILNASNQLTLLPEAGSAVSGPNIDVVDSYNKLVYSVIGVAGLKVRAGSFYLAGEAQFQYGLINVINSKNRTNTESVFDYATQFNNYRQSNAAISLRFIYPLFNPRKNIKRG